MSVTRRVSRLVMACSAVLMTELLCTGVSAQPGGSSIMFKPQPRQDGNAFPVLLAALTPSGTLAQTDAATGPIPIDLDPAEGAAVIGKLQDLQQRLRRGEKPSFTLLSGGPIVLGMTTVPPREAFLRVRFESADFITRVEGVRPKTLKGYSIAAPYESGKLWCTISVRAWERDGKIDTVAVECGAPPPALPPPPPRISGHRVPADSGEAIPRPQ